MSGGKFFDHMQRSQPSPAGLPLGRAMESINAGADSAAIAKQLLDKLRPFAELIFTDATGQKYLALLQTIGLPRVEGFFGVNLVDATHVSINQGWLQVT